MKKVFRAIIVLSFSAFLFLTPGPSAQAQSAGPFYVGVFGGFVIPNDLEFDEDYYDDHHHGHHDDWDDDEYHDFSLDNSWALGAKFGYIVPPIKWLAVELEYSYLGKQDLDEKGHTYNGNKITYDGDFSAHNVMINALFRYPQGFIHPYVGLGFGVSLANIEINRKVESNGSENIVDENEVGFASQFIAGVNFEITRNWSADIAYKFLYSEYDTDYEDRTIEAKNHMIVFGINYHF